ncbi:hypothetical protein VIGAN_10223400 [Vigna angularis var. angularis]|uniref:Uncharacterized protein n=1 Tax=Vigna angularis var. angularis TaxID=157739 RepID=A0A0S3T725_PHAAN|nr:hypothetical protein VIGAN_10223400 [Vigna angularis var. angularis]
MGALGLNAHGENPPVDILEPLSETETLPPFLLLVDVLGVLSRLVRVSPFKSISVLARLILPALKDWFNVICDFFILKLSVMLPYLGMGSDGDADGNAGGDADRFPLELRSD